MAKLYTQCISSQCTHTQTHIHSLIILITIVFVDTMPQRYRDNAKKITESIKRKFSENINQSFKQSRTLRKFHFRYSQVLGIYTTSQISISSLNYKSLCLHLGVFTSLLVAEFLNSLTHTNTHAYSRKNLSFDVLVQYNYLYR